MSAGKYVITGVNALTGEREVISFPMPQALAIERLQREQEARRRQRYPAHKMLRVERVCAYQLNIEFEREQI